MFLIAVVLLILFDVFSSFICNKLSAQDDNKSSILRLKRVLSFVSIYHLVMQQMYLVEVFVDKASIFAPKNFGESVIKPDVSTSKPELKNVSTSKPELKKADEVKTDDGKKSHHKFMYENDFLEMGLICKIRFGEKTQFIVKQGQITPTKTDVKKETDDQGRIKFERYIRVGKSVLFPSFPDTMFNVLTKYPLEVELWTDYEDEDPEIIGIGYMQWHTDFFIWLRDTSDICVPHKPISIKTIVTLMLECCCVDAAEVSIIVRMTALGDCVVTEFQQNMSDPSLFCFKTDKYPSIYECETVEADNPDYQALLGLYDIAVEDDPTIIAEVDDKVEVCTELQACVLGQKGLDEKCKTESLKKKKRRIEKVRMGDIKGPCGNASCPVAHKVKTYIRNLESYKQDTWGKVPVPKGGTRKICGQCDCKQDKYHTQSCNEEQLRRPPVSQICPKCGGISQHYETCEDKKMRFFGTGVTPLTSKTHITNYLISTTRIPNPLYNTNFTVNNFSTKYDFADVEKAGSSQYSNEYNCGCVNIKPSLSMTNTNNNNIQTNNILPNISKNSKPSTSMFGPRNQVVYNVTEEKKHIFCLDIPDDTECRCNPTIPSPACQTLDCDCIINSICKDERKTHKAFCPSYKHKDNCPVMMTSDDEENEPEAEEVEPLPFGLPPVSLGPCSVLGRPCTVPDGFARMYKTASLPPLPPSYSEAGKVCCRREFERIKKIIKGYMTFEKGNDFRCVHQYTMDTEKNCCDKEQMLMTIMGKSCCGSHKMSKTDEQKNEKI